MSKVSLRKDLTQSRKDAKTQRNSFFAPLRLGDFALKNASSL
jgi:hypothetical protein